MAEEYKNPTPTADTIIEIDGGFVMIERKNEPLGWALPGGFVDEGELLESAAIREVKEETSLDVQLTELLYLYSDPKRDPRKHTITAVYIGTGSGQLKAADDAINAKIFTEDNLPKRLLLIIAVLLKTILLLKKPESAPCRLRLFNGPGNNRIGRTRVMAEEVKLTFRGRSRLLDYKLKRYRVVK